MTTKREKRRKKARSAHKSEAKRSDAVYERRAGDIAVMLHPDWKGMNTDIKREALDIYKAILRDGEGGAAEAVAAALTQAHLDVVSEVIDRQEIALQLAEDDLLATTQALDEAKHRVDQMLVDEVADMLMVPIDTTLSERRQVEARSFLFQKIGAALHHDWTEMQGSEQLRLMHLYQGCVTARIDRLRADLHNESLAYANVGDEDGEDEDDIDDAAVAALFREGMRELAVDIVAAYRRVTRR